MVGPNFTRPAPPRLDVYAPPYAQVRLAADGAIQTIEPGRSVDPAWWRLFGSADLDALVSEGLKTSPTLDAAIEALRQGRDKAQAGAGVFYPGLGASAQASRERVAQAELGGRGAGSTFSLYTLSGAVSYAIDLFGGERRGVEALRAQAEQRRQAVGSAWLLLTGDIVDCAIAMAGYADQAAALTDIVRLDGAQRDILATAYRAGEGPWSAVLEAEQHLAADRESLALTLQRRAAAATLLTTLVGRENGQGAPASPTLGALSLPSDLPVSLPSQLVRQRPDILEAEAAMHEASAQVGVATAAMFPSITLTADYGSASAALGRLGGPAGEFWSVGPSLSAPIFEGGALKYGRRAAQAGLRKAQADYRQTVLAALEQVADSLHALDADAAVAAADRDAFDAAGLNVMLAAANRRAGMIADHDVMTLRVEAERARLGLIAAKTQRLQDVVALYVACGGGWTAAPLAASAVP